MKKRIYLDYAAATPLLPEVAAAMEEIMIRDFGNPSSLHEEGRAAKAHLQKARETLARAIGAETDEIFFTSGGSEANFLSITGLASKGHLITTAIEHSSVLGTFQRLEAQSYEVTYLPVEENGIVNPDTFKKAIKQNTALASIMTANNEIGTIQPIDELAEIAKSNRIIFHTDAIQGFPHLPIKINSIDSLALSAQKIYGPKGVGAFYLKRGTPYNPVWKGGEQERKIRPGTENVPGIVGFAKAVEILLQQRKAESNRLKKLRDQFMQSLTAEIPDCKLNGDPIQRLPNNVNLTFRGVDGESLLIQLDLNGISCSMGSACSAGALEPSHVLMALGRTPEEAKRSLRFTLGKTTTEEELEKVKKDLHSFVETMRLKKGIRRW